MTTDPQKAKHIKSRLIETFDAIAPHFDITRYKPWPESKRFISTLKKGYSVLDLGCGNGRNSIYLAREGMNVVGLDFSRALLRIVSNKAEWRDVHHRIRLIEGDCAWLPLKSNFFDAVLYIATLHHLPSPKERLNSLLEVKRCLKPGGCALVSAWAQEQEKFRDELEMAKEKKEKGLEYGDIFLPWKMKEGREYLRFYHLFSKEEFEELIEKCGFVKARIFFSADNHYAELRKGP